MNFQVLCFDVPSVDSLFCTICSVWESVEGMLEHMQSFQHYDTYVVRIFLKITIFQSFETYFVEKSGWKSHMNI